MSTTYLRCTLAGVTIFNYSKSWLPIKGQFNAIKAIKNELQLHLIKEKLHRIFFAVFIFCCIYDKHYFKVL